MPSRRVPWLALGWIVVGAAIAIGAWRMDRLEQMHINPYSAPGVVPGLLGVLIVLFGAALAWREWRLAAGATASGATASGASASGASASGASASGVDDLRHPVLVASLCCLAFVGGLLGRGLPFAASAALFVFVYIVLFSRRQWQREGRLARGVATAAAIAVVACGAIALLFTEVFLVRLP